MSRPLRSLLSLLLALGSLLAAGCGDDDVERATDDVRERVAQCAIMPSRSAGEPSGCATGPTAWALARGRSAGGSSAG